MDITKTLIALATVVSVCIAQNITISGTVTDTGVTPIEGAVVMLEKAGYTDTTDANGNFTLTDITGINDQLNQSFPCKISAFLKNDLLGITLAEKSAVKVVAYTLQGKVFYSIQRTMNAGTHSLSIPHIGSGVHFYKIKTGSSEFVLKCNSIGNMSFVTSASAKETSSMNPAKRAENHFQIDDIIKSVKSGYLNYRVIVTNSDTNNIEIKMIVCADTVRDADGNLYQAVRIGNQIWTVENLRTTKYNDGTVIPCVQDSAAWDMCTTPAYCFINNTINQDTIRRYGALYNWYTVNTGKLTPSCWHVPSDAEWDTLQNYLITNGHNWDGSTMGNKIAKSLAAKEDWYPNPITGAIGNDLRANNRNGFSALPGSSRNNNGLFFAIGGYGNWWSDTERDTNFVWTRHLRSAVDYLKRDNRSKCSGFSVRLVRD